VPAPPGATATRPLVCSMRLHWGEMFFYRGRICVTFLSIPWWNRSAMAGSSDGSSGFAALAGPPTPWRSCLFPLRSLRWLLSGLCRRPRRGCLRRPFSSGCSPVPSSGDGFRIWLAGNGALWPPSASIPFSGFFPLSHPISVFFWYSGC